MRPLLPLSLLALAGCQYFASPELDLDQLDGNLGDAQAMALQPSLDWQCKRSADADVTTMGDHYCDGLGKKINGIPAERLVYFFRDGKLASAMVEFNPDAYPTLVAQLDAAHKRHSTMDGMLAAASNQFRGALTAWDAKDGIALTSPTAKKANGDVVLLWISNQELARKQRVR